MIDVCVIVEGTYPYVAGGVSTWIHQMISTMSNIKFGVIHIASHSDPTRTLKYQMPGNLIYLKEIYLHDYRTTSYARRKPRLADYQTFTRAYQSLRSGDYTQFPDLMRLFYGQDACFDAYQFITSKPGYQILNYFYDTIGEHVSYLDFFWTWRGTHHPLLEIIQTELPKAKVYHAISTGYAGMVGAIARIYWGTKYLLTEHGIYNYERMIEIAQATWLFEPETRRFMPTSQLSFFKRWWIKLFQIMSGVAYQYADRIFTIYEGNRTRQILDGAAPEKLAVIPNGIDFKYFNSVERKPAERPSVGLVGRVVSIKDIKTFIQAAKLVLRTVPEARFYVIGPTDEEPDYYEECRMLVEMLNLEDHIEFTGRVNVMDYYRFLDVVVLTSLSEAQPYTVHEANAAGIPVVATDVGACRELLEGRDAEDQMIGASGLITDVNSPEGTSAAIVSLLSDPGRRERMGRAGIERVKRYYELTDMITQYLNIYEKYI